MTGFADGGDAVRVELARRRTGRRRPARLRRRRRARRPAGGCCPTSGRRYAGYVAWRGMVPEADLDDRARGRFGDAITYFVYANSHILAVPDPRAGRIGARRASA